MRIISGKRRGLRLTAVGSGDLAAHLRPTTDRVRESIFNVLMGGHYGNPISGARVLDLYAGTGALGLEAWSRGAEQVTFVDSGSKSLSLIKQNVALCDAGPDVTILRQDAARLGPCKSAPFDLIFLDPPYGKNLGEKTLADALACGWLAKDALIIWEENAAKPTPDGFQTLNQRQYGDTHLTILKTEGTG